jgi:hypothetical protein
MAMKSSVFWDIRSCGPLKVSHCFGGICHLRFQSVRTSQARNHHEEGRKVGLWSLPHVPPKRQLAHPLRNECYCLIFRLHICIYIYIYIHVRKAIPATGYGGL